MPGLESNSHPIGALPGRCAPPGRFRHARDEQVGRHRHERPYAAVILSGGYVEAGDSGRHRAEPGSIILHRAFEAHRHAAGRKGAEVLLIELDRAPNWAMGRLDDPDLLVELAERDPQATRAMLLDKARPQASAPMDWPDILASDLIADPSLGLADWADRHGLHRGSLGRGFRGVFAMTPADFRQVQKTRRALTLLQSTGCRLAEVAALCGFSDQPHMTRAIRSMTGSTPQQVRQALSTMIPAYSGLSGHRLGGRQSALPNRDL